MSQKRNTGRSRDTSWLAALSVTHVCTGKDPRSIQKLQSHPAGAGAMLLRAMGAPGCEAAPCGAARQVDPALARSIAYRPVRVCGGLRGIPEDEEGPGRAHACAPLPGLCQIYGRW